MSIMELLEKVSALDLLFAVILVVTLTIILATQKKKINKWLNKWRKDKNEEEDFHSLVYSLRDSVKELSDRVEKQQKERDKELLGYRDDSRKIREKMYKVMDEQSEGIKELKKTVLQIQEKNSKTKRAEIKEKIERIYRECSPTQTCTDMAFETLKDLIEEYEEHGGDNSFVHKTVQPELYTWKVVSTVRGD